METAINNLRQEFDGKQEADKIQVLEVEKEDLINKEMKSYENNIKVVGLQFLNKDAAKRDDAGRTNWRKSILQKVLVDTGIVKADKVFHNAGPNKGKEIRRIFRNAHLLHQKNNAPIIIVFTESWFANQVKDKLCDTKKLKLGPPEQRLKIHPHYPVIIDSLKNEALRERRTMLENSTRKIICQTSMTKPWVSLFQDF
jgi:hypothetical protein